VTNCAFGGPDMDLLFITTAARNIDLEKYPKAGGLFCAQTSVCGLLSPAFILG
jgi:sugar lactone lactonase YvrE